MQIVRTSEELARARGGTSGTLAFVPTMGALHLGHMTLIAEARKRAEKVVASIFVNPTQFGPNEDFTRYPRREDQDSNMLAEAGCDLLWCPSVEDIYPAGSATTVHVSGISERWEGKARPGHFDGVATVVAKLLLSVRPNVALFGEKDFQQLAVIRRMAEDLNLSIEIAGVPTARDGDGLALSSRNAYLNEHERRQAAVLPRTLETARRAILTGASIPKVLDEASALLRQQGFARVDYLALVDALTLEPIVELKGTTRLIAAAVIGQTRLIDNIAV